MSNADGPMNSPLFPRGYRASGLLLPATSLPSPYGIGDLGRSAYEWVDRLHEAGQSWWQALPLGPTGYGNSPYQCLSSFVGNGLLISPQLLIADGLLQPNDCTGSFSPDKVDYDVVIPFKHRLLGKAYTRFQAGARKDLMPAYEEFCHSRANWLMMFIVMILASIAAGLYASRGVVRALRSLGRHRDDEEPDSQ